MQAQPRAEIETTLLSRCGSQLAAVLQGRCEPLTLLFPPDGGVSAEQLYRDAPGAQAFNQLVAEAVSSAAAGLPRGRRLRVLEIGAGTGGTTAALLPRLPAEVSYVFTDVSAGFLAPAREKFAAHDFIDYRVLDIERDPLEQGLSPHSFDVVLAANVLHTTADLRQVVRHVKQVLAPAGLLVLLEGTRRQRWIDLLFGLLEGWWKFTDAELRVGHPLLSEAGWSRLLQEEGFTAPLSLPAREDVEQAVLVARGPNEVAAAPVPTTCRRLIFADAGGIGAILAEQLAGSVLVEAGSSFERVLPERYRLDPTRPDDYARLLAETDAAGEVIYLWGAESVAGEPPAQAQAACERLLYLVQGLARSGQSPPRLLVVTRGAQAVVPEDQLDGLPHAALWGLARVIVREHPELHSSVLDLDASASASECAGQLLQELAWTDDAEGQLALRGGQRFAARLVRSQRPAAVPPALVADATYLIAGGLGDLGLLTARWLTERGARHLLLLGRNPPSMQARAAIDRLEVLGATVQIVVADIASAAQLSEAVTEATRTLPPVRGIIHAAGVLDDGVLLNQTRERFATVLTAKVAGAWNLHELSRAWPLDFFVLYSSAASLLGTPGQGNHAAANSFEDALAAHRRARGLPALSINWGVWSEIGAAARRGVVDQTAARGMGTIDPQAGLQVLERILGLDIAQLGVLPADWPRFFQHGEVPAFLSQLAGRSRRTESRRGAQERIGDIAGRLQGAAPAERRETLVAYVQRQVARVLGQGDDKLPERHKGFFELGMDSLMAVELRNRLQTELGSTIGMVATTVFDYPTATALGEFLDHQLFPTSARALPAAEIAAAPDEPQADESLQALSDEELGELLDERIDRILRD